MTADSATIPHFNRAGVGELVPVNPASGNATSLTPANIVVLLPLLRNITTLRQGGVRVAWLEEPVAVVFRDKPAPPPAALLSCSLTQPLVVTVLLSSSAQVISAEDSASVLNLDLIETVLLDP